MPRVAPTYWRRVDPMVLERVVSDTWVDVNEMLGLKDVETARGLGHTRHQMLTAPRGAWFVWCWKDTSYPRDLAQSVGRQDLQIMANHWLQHGADRTPHKEPIVVDHAFYQHN